MNLTLSWSWGQNRASTVHLVSCTAPANQQPVSDCYDWGYSEVRSRKWDTLSHVRGRGTVCPLSRASYQQSVASLSGPPRNRLNSKLIVSRLSLRGLKAKWVSRGIH